MEQATYWHIAAVNEAGEPCLRHNDGRVIRVGETLKVEGTPIICEHGLHACKRLIDCLQYCKGTVICEVTLGGEVVHGDDKSAAQERTVLRMTTPEQGEKILREFARWCALSVAHLWNMPDVVRQYLETGDESIRDAARVAARDAARAVAGAAVRDAAWAAAWAAARDAAGAAAWAAAGDAQNNKLVEMVQL
jgi:hypothetical protein